jgi:hypothetical protein
MPRTLIERWNGERWTIVEGPTLDFPGHYLEGVAAIATDDVWAVGTRYTDTFEDRPFVIHWNGDAWSVVPTPAVGEAQLVEIDAVGPNDIWAVGHTSGGDEHPLIEHWNGTRWRVIPAADLGTDEGTLYGVGARVANDVWAVGRRSDGVNPSRPLTMRWNGTAWKVRSAPSINDEGHDLYDVVAISRTNAWAVGTSFGTDTASVLLHWNGTKWKATDHPDAGDPGRDGLNGIAATSAANVWAVGRACDASNACASLVLHWDGSAWTVQPSASPPDSTSLFGIAASSSSDVWAVGNTRLLGEDAEPFAVHCC